MSEIAPLDRPVLVGCAGRCGGIVPILWPSQLDPKLQQLRGELHQANYVLAEAEAAGERCMAVLCSRCAQAAMVKTAMAAPAPRVDSGKKRK